MERKIGEIFEYEGRKLEVVKQKPCEGCFFFGTICTQKIDITGKCVSRLDCNLVIFKEVKTK